MTEWQDVPLTSLGYVARGRSRHRPRNDPSLYDGVYPFFQTGDVKAADFYLEEYSQTYNEKGLQQSKLWPAGTLCITIAANIAESSILRIEGCFPDSVVGFQSNPNISDVRFVKYLFDLMKVRYQQIAKGTTQDNLSLQKLFSLNVRVPPLPIQKRIAGILSAYDDLIAVNERRIAILEEMARRVFEEFVLVEIGSYPEPTAIATTLAPIRDWSFAALGEIAIVTAGQSPKSEYYNLETRGKPFHQGVADFNQFFHVNRVYCDLKSGIRLAESGDILFSVRAPVGRIAIALNEMIIGRGIASIRGVDLGQNYILTYLRTVFSETDIMGNGAVYKAISQTELKSIPIAVPPADQAQRLEMQLSSFWASIKLIFQANQNLRATRDLLLPRLISGEIDVSEAPFPETVAKE